MSNRLPIGSEHKAKVYFSRIIDQADPVVEVSVQSSMVQHPQKFSSLDSIYKSIGSLLPPRNGCTVQTMDRLTVQELEGSIIHESHSKSGPTYTFGFLINIIFATCRQQGIPEVSKLTIPLKVIRIRDSRLQDKFAGYPESSKVLLYNSRVGSWNWVLDSEEAVGGIGNWDSQSNGPPLHQEKEFTYFLNTVCMAIKNKFRPTTESQSAPVFTAHRCWMADWLDHIMPSAYNYNRKPDLILLENELVPHNKISWKSLKILAELMRESFTPTARIARTLDTKAYLIMIEQPWRRFVLALSFSKLKLRLHFYNHSGGSISPPFHLQRNPQEFLFILTCVVFSPCSCIGFDDTVNIIPKIPVPSPLLTKSSTNFPPVNCVSVPSLSSSTQEIYGTIRVRRDIYEILGILFSSTGFLGRGTVCYLAVCNGIVYVIKDHWVSGSPLHEVGMLKHVQGIKGVLTYVDSWEVEVEEDVVETTERYREERFRRKMKSIHTHVRLVTTP